MSFKGRKLTFSRENWAMCEEKPKTAQTLRLIGGESRERTILRRHITFNKTDLGPIWSLSGIWPEYVNKCIGGDKRPISWAT